MLLSSVLNFYFKSLRIPPDSRRSILCLFRFFPVLLDGRAGGCFDSCTEYISLKKKANTVSMTQSSNTGNDGPQDPEAPQNTAKGKSPDNTTSVPPAGGVKATSDAPEAPESRELSDSDDAATFTLEGEDSDADGAYSGGVDADNADNVVSFAELRRRQQGTNAHGGGKPSDTTKHSSGKNPAGAGRSRFPSVWLGGHRASSTPHDAAHSQNGFTGQTTDGQHPPMINLPPMVKALLAANIGVFLLMMLPFMPSKILLVMDFGFVPARYTGTAEFGGWRGVVAPLSHMFLHSGWLHIIMNVSMLMAFGAGVEKMYGSTRFLLFYLGCGLFGVLAHLAIYPDSLNPVIGASGAISGLFAAVLIMLQGMGGLGNGRFGLLPVVGVWIGISVLFAAMNGFGVGEIAWAAHLGGFIGGFALLRLPYFKIA